MKRLLSIDPFVVMLLGTILLASILPATGMAAHVVAIAADAGIVALFFLHGARLSREAVIAGARHWRLHLTVLLTTFALFPLLGLGIASIPGIPVIVGTGMLFLTLLPSTVQSSIAFTAIARGNVAAAVCSASFSNLIGIVLTPLLAALLMAGDRGMPHISAASIWTIVGQLLVPFLAGHLLRPWIGAWVIAHKKLLTFVDRGSILLVVYSAFGAAVVEGLWRTMPPAQLALILLLCSLLLSFILAFTWFIAPRLGFVREDAIVLQFCGSKKSLATGVPFAGVLFPAATVGTVLLPVIIFHQIQLIACAFLARHYAATADPEGAPAAA